MKKWIAALLFVALTPSAYATDDDVKHIAKVCQMVAEIGEGIMAMRQGGHTKQEIRSRGEPSPMIDKLINAAFEVPEIKDRKRRAVVTNAFKGDVYLICLKEAAES